MLLNRLLKLRELLSNRRFANSARKAPRRSRWWLEALEDRTLPSPLTVTKSADDGNGDVAHTLSWAINNANGNPGSTIEFEVSQVNPTSVEPYISSSVTIDGTDINTGNPCTLDGTSAGTGPIGLDISNPGGTVSKVTIEDLVIENYSKSGIRINSTASNNTITGNVLLNNGLQGLHILGNNNYAYGNTIGIDSSGNLKPNAENGIDIDGGANNHIGGTANGDANVISGNDYAGVAIYGASATGNVVIGNRIGTDETGTMSVPNGTNGVLIENGASANTIGGITSGDANVISGNTQPNVLISGSNRGASNNLVEGNYIGTNAGGTAIISNGNGGNGNGAEGVKIANGATNNTASGNTISGNAGSGVFIADSGTTGNVVNGNYIGTDSTGETGLGNVADGVHIQNTASDNTIQDNVISGNMSDGVRIKDNGTDGNQVLDNYIGTDYTGTTTTGSDGHPLGNGVNSDLSGVLIDSGPQDTLVQGNVISGNGAAGVEITGSETNQSTIADNDIGTDYTGTHALGNAGPGVYVLDGAQDNTIGGSAALANTIGFNAGAGVAVGASASDTTTIDNIIRCNSIYGNGDLGINLGTQGFVPNGSLGQSGPNNFLNFPVITTASPGTSTTVTGTFSGAANTILDFFASPSPDSSGYGQGQTYLGSYKTTVNASFNVTFSVETTENEWITGTATDPSGNTSEFSQAVQADTIIPTQLAVTTEPPSSIPEYTPFTYAVTAEDDQGEVDTNFTGQVTVALSSNPTGATLGGTLTLNAVAGVASFGNLTVSTPGNGYVLDASNSGLSDGVSDPFMVTRATPSVTPNPVSITYGTALDNSQLSGTATFNGHSVAGSFSYTTADGVVLNAGQDQMEEVTFTPTDTTDYNSAYPMVTVNVAQAKATIVITPYTTATAVYDGFPYTATGTATGVGGVDLSGDLDLSHTTHTNAGTYSSDYWTFTDATGNYVDVGPTTITDSIAQASAQITVTPYSVTYDGNPHTATGTAIGVGGVDLSGDLDLSHTTHTNAGTYSTDSWTFTDPTGDYVNVGPTTITDSIAKANATIVITPYTTATAVYDGSSYTATGTATGAGGVDLSSELNLSGTTHTDAGTYNGDVWTFTDTTGNYNNTSGMVNDSIAKANATITITPYTTATAVYNGSSYTGTGTATGVGGVDLSSELNLSGTTHTDAGTYNGDVWTFTDTTGNYNSTSGTITDSIAKANASITVTGYDVPYDGNPHTATGSATGIDGELLSGLDLSGTTHTDGGAYIDPWTFTDVTGNYNNASGAVDDTITKINANIVVTPYTSPSAVYNGSPYTATGTATGVGGVDLSGELNLSGTTHTNAGTYNGDTWTFSGDSNYNAANGMVNDSIAQATPNVSVNPVNIVEGTPLANSQLSGTATCTVKGQTVNVPGTFAYTTAAGVVLNAGNGQVEDVTFTPTDSIDFATEHPTVIVNVDQATQLVITMQPPSSVTAGSPFTILVSAEDNNGNVDTTFSAGETISLVSNPGGSTLGGVLTQTAVDGVATFTGLTLDKFGQGYQLQVSTSAFPPVQTQPFDVTAGAATELAFSVQPSDTTAGNAISPAVQVQVFDKYGNPATNDSGTPVTLSVASGPGNFAPGSTTTVFDSAGVATFSNLVLDTAGPGYTLAENAPGGVTGPDSNSFTVNPAVADHLSFAVPPGFVLANGTIEPAVQVDVLDRFGNLVTGDSSDQVGLLLASGPGTFAAASTTSEIVTGGVASFSKLALNKTGSYTLLAASSSDLIAATTSFSVVKAPSFKVTLAPATPGATAAGQAFTLKISALLAGKLDTGYLGTVQVTSSDPQVPTTTVTFLPSDGGAKTVMLTLKTPGKQVVRVADTSLPTDKATSNAVTVTGTLELTLNHFIVSGLPVTDIAGTAHTITITAVNAGNQTVTTYNGKTVHVTSSDPAIQPFDVTLSNGVGKKTVILSTPGVQSLTVSGGGASGSEANIVVVSPATHLGITVSPATITAGDQVTLTVTALTAANKTDALFADTLLVTTNDPLAQVGTPTIAGGAATYAITFFTAGTHTITVTDLTRPTIKGPSKSVTVNTAAATQLVVTSAPLFVVANKPVAITVTAEDAFGNTVPAGFLDKVTLSTGQSVTFQKSDKGKHVFMVTFSTTGTVALTASDSTKSSVTTSSPVNIDVVSSAVGVSATDPTGGSGEALIVVVPAGGGTVQLMPTTAGTSIQVTEIIAGKKTTFGPFPLTTADHIIVYGQTGNDVIEELPGTISGSPKIAVPAILLGGSGTNTLSAAGSSVGNVLVGGPGKDSLTGGSGRDVLIGGGGADTLNAGSGGDVLIGGITAFDANLMALEALPAEWDSGDGYQTRVRDLFGNGGVGQNGTTLLNAETVINDLAVNQINGGSGMDWFWLEGATDKFSREKAGEIVTLK